MYLKEMDAGEAVGTGSRSCDMCPRIVSCMGKVTFLISPVYFSMFTNKYGYGLHGMGKS